MCTDYPEPCKDTFPDDCGNDEYTQERTCTCVDHNDNPADESICTDRNIEKPEETRVCPATPDCSNS